MPLDWTKPIQFQNGEECELVETRPDGFRQWSPREDGVYLTRLIHLLGRDESTLGRMMCSYWYYYEDGKAPPSMPGYDIVNKT